MNQETIRKMADAEGATMPNFFVVGAQKAGTTSLYHYLDQHPDVFMSPAKEPFFFDHELDPSGTVIKHEFGRRSLARNPRFANIAEYLTLFEGVQGETAVGEASPLYIYAPGTASRIKRYSPGAKIATRPFSFSNDRRLGKLIAGSRPVTYPSMAA